MDFVINAAKKVTDNRRRLWHLPARQGRLARTWHSHRHVQLVRRALFDEKWQPQFNGPEWKKTLTTYVDLMKEVGPPGASSNGFNENLVCSTPAMRHVDRRHGRGVLYH